MTCPDCGSPAAKVIYFGFPMKLCLWDECSLVFGFWGFVAWVCPIPTLTEFGPMFKFVRYDDAYLVALWRWVLWKEVDNE